MSHFAASWILRESTSHPYHSDSLYRIHFGSMTDFEEASIVLFRVRPHPSRFELLNSLAHALWDRFGKTGSMTDRYWPSSWRSNFTASSIHIALALDNLTRNSVYYNFRPLFFLPPLLFFTNWLVPYSFLQAFRPIWLLAHWQGTLKEKFSVWLINSVAAKFSSVYGYDFSIC